MYNDENDAVALARRLAIYDYVLIDTCSLMEDSFPMWMDRLAAAKVYLSDSPTQIYVPKECIIELERHSKNKEDFNKRATAKRALIILKKAKKQKLVTILKKQKKEPKSKAFADRAIYVKVSADRSNQKILVVTQDKKLASDLIALNNLLSQKGRYAHVLKFDANSGQLVPNRGENLYENNNHRSEINASNKDHSDKTPSKQNPKPISAGLGGKKHGFIRPAASPAKNVGEKVEGQNGKPSITPSAQKEATPLKENAPQTSVKPIEQKIEEKKPVEKKADAPVAEKKKEAKLPFRFGMGADVETALSNCAFSAGLMFRYPSIPYLSQFHGPVDLTENDLKEILAALEGPTTEAKHFSGKGLFWRAEQLTPRSIRVTVERDEKSLPPSTKVEEVKDEVVSKKPLPKEKVENKPAKKPLPEKEAKVEAKKESPAQTQPPVLTEEEYAAGKAKILAEKDYISSRNINAIFQVGPYRGNKILKRLQSEAVLSDVADPTRGFRVLKDVEEEAEAKSVPASEPKPSMEAPSMEAKTPAPAKPKAKRQNKAPAKAKKPGEAKEGVPSKPVAATQEKNASKPEKDSANKAKKNPPAKKQTSPAKAASPKQEVSQKKEAPAQGKKPVSKKNAATVKTHPEAKKPSTSKKVESSVKGNEEISEQGRLVVLAPTSEEEHKHPARKPSKPKEKNASITVKDGKRNASPKPQAPSALSEAFLKAKKKEEELGKLLADTSLPRETVLKALDEQLTLVEPLAPQEKRKLHYHKTQLLLLKKDLL